jgi:signal peptidase II
MTEGKRPVPWEHWFLFFTIALGGSAFDLLTKAWIFRSVGPPGSPPRPLVADILELRTSHNSGALWGIGRGWPYSSLFFALLSVAAAGAILYFLFVRGGAADRWLTAALGLITAGALGNCYDRLWLGYVRDFAYFHVDSIGFSCAIFNFADNMLVIGAIALMLLALRPDRSDASGPLPERADAVARTVPFEAPDSGR